MRSSFDPQSHHICSTPATILAGFERAVALAPAAVALVHGDRRMTYCELDQWSNRISRWIALRAGACLHGREPLIPFALSQSPERVAVLLAILKLGGAYVPIEPSYPAVRIRGMLADIGASFIITESALADGVLAAADCEERLLEALQVDVERPAIDRQDAGPLAPDIGPDSACYVMYTSGSTGAPKGVVVTHRGVVRLCIDTDYMRVQPEHGFGHLANIAFDAATWEIWGALLNGARTVLIDPEAVLSTAALGRAIREDRITHIFLTTALYNQHTAADPTVFAPLEYLLFGGEAASAAAVRRHLRRRRSAAPPRPRLRPHREHHLFDRPRLTAPPVGEAVPIGKAITGSTCHVVQEVEGRLVLAPPNERGELLVGGLGLAREYLHDEAATRAKFVECAFAPGERLYRTGDLVETQPSGDLVFVGRRDNQIKLRGFRIELEEIELALAAHPAIGGVVVMIEEGADEHRRLVATLVANDHELPTARELRDFVKARLPSYMVPSAFMSIAAFPLGPTGKVDRRRIAGLPRDALTTGTPLRAARTATEARVRRVWALALSTTRGHAGQRARPLRARRRLAAGGPRRRRATPRRGRRARRPRRFPRADDRAARRPHRHRGRARRPRRTP